MDANKNSHEITIRIHEVQYNTVVAKLRKVFRNTDRMKFIKGLQSQKDYGDLSTRGYVGIRSLLDQNRYPTVKGMIVNEDKIKPFDWSESLYIIIVTLTEGARNKIVAAYVQYSQSGRNQLLVNNWSRISDSTNKYTSNITIKGLDPKERGLMIGFVARKTVKEVLDMLIASSKVCRAMCQHPVRD
uniref:Uncharacterized protein n=1 Tax=Tanacetum cinerariifolium TaxID=118510 RepID=A0A699IBK4_TANCI|nr:hypothetical protein [Tanacetum cinerariifolium]